jgi:GAF domain-containing protein
MAAADRGSVLVTTAHGPLFQRAGEARPEDGSDGSELLGVAERVLYTARPAVLADSGLDSAKKGAATTTARGQGAVACVPLRDGERVVGLLTLEGKMAGIAFSDLEVEFLESLADRASSLLNRFHVELRELRSVAVLAELEAGQLKGLRLN